MTYTPVRTITVLHNRLSESTDLTKIASSFIGKEAYLVIKNNSFNHVLSIGQILTFVPGLDLTQPIGTVFSALFSDVFIERFENTLIPIALSSGLYRKRLSVFDACAYKNYTVRFTSINTPNITDDVKQKGFLDDLVITSPNNDLSQCLVAVNGVFHRTVLLNDALYVLDGFRTIRISGRKDVTIVDTQALGGHTIVPLTKDNVTTLGYQKGASTHLDQSLMGKTVLAVIDGYLYHSDQNVLRLGDGSHVFFKTNKMPLIAQFRHNPRTLYRVDRYGQDAPQSSRKYTDAYENIFLNHPTIPAASLANQDFEYSRLTAYHSFLIVLNTPSVFNVSTPICASGTPQLYEDLSKRSLSGMLHYGCGLSPTYLIHHDPSNRKTIFIPEQDYDVDWQDHSLNAPFIPTLIKDPKRAAQIPARLVDYVCA